MGVQQTPLFEGERIEPKLRFTRVRHRNSSSASVLTSSVFSGILGTLTGSMRVNCQVLFVIAALTCAIAQQPPTSDFILEQNVSIPTRDGVLLRADILRPKGDGPFPILVYRTPYGKHLAQKEYTIFRRAVQRGHAIVIQDVRGRYASDGEFRPYENEGRDGYDPMERVAKQRWSYGNVGTFGLSYPGAVQWLAAVETPRQLKAIVRSMTYSTPQNFFYASGTWDMSWIEWIWDNIDPDVRAGKN